MAFRFGKETRKEENAFMVYTFLGDSLMHTRWKIALAMVLLLGWGATASADIIQFQEDLNPTTSYQNLTTYIRNSATGSDSNNGEASTWQLGRTATANDYLRCIAGYDISAIPAGSTINSVTLTVSPRMNEATSLDASYGIEIHEISNHDFTEASVTWLNRYTGQPTTAWTTPGSEYYGTVLSSLSLNPKHWADGASQPPTAPASNVTYVFASSSAFVTAAQNALNGGHRFDMLLLSPDAEALATGNRIIFPFAGDDPVTSASSPSRKTIQSQAPMLTIDYTPIPEPASWLLCSFAALGLLGYGIRRNG
jgi:hypothetical protein